MTIKGNYASGTSYSVGDVVKEGGRWYTLVKSASAGTNPTDTKFWQPFDPTQATLMDIVDDIYDKLNTLSPNPKNIVLASSTDASVKKFSIKIVDNGTISGTEIS